MLINNAIDFYRFDKIVFREIYFNFIVNIRIEFIAINY